MEPYILNLSNNLDPEDGLDLTPHSGGSEATSQSNGSRLFGLNKELAGEEQSLIWLTKQLNEFRVDLGIVVFSSGSFAITLLATAHVTPSSCNFFKQSLSSFSQISWVSIN